MTKPNLVTYAGDLRLVHARDRMERFGYRSLPSFLRMLKREQIPHLKLAGRAYLDDEQVDEWLRARMEASKGRKRRSTIALPQRSESANKTL